MNGSAVSSPSPKSELNNSNNDRRNAKHYSEEEDESLRDQQKEGVKRRESYLPYLDDNDDAAADESPPLDPERSELKSYLLQHSDENGRHDESAFVVEDEAKLRKSYLAYLDEGENDGTVPPSAEAAVPRGSQIPDHSTATTTTPPANSNLPGAYLGRPGEGLRRRDDVTLDGVSEQLDLEQQSSTFVVSSSALHRHNDLSGVFTSSNRRISNSNLAVAQEVLEGNSQMMIMQAAEEVDPEATEKKKAHQKKQNQQKFFLLALSVIAAIVGATLLSTIFGRPQKDDHNKVQLSSSTTMAPSSSESHPSSAPSTGALDLLREMLSEDTKASLDRFNTPQWRAWDWLENHPELPTMEETRKQQLFALATIYYSMDGDNWREAIQGTWLRYDQDECYWFSSEFGGFQSDGQYRDWETSFGINPCSGSGDGDGAGAEGGSNDDDNDDDNGEFRSLTLSNLGLAGSSNQPILLPAEVALLTSLSILSLAWNDINATLSNFLPSPELYHRMPNLTILNLHRNSLMGPIPTDFGRMTNLLGLELGKNPLGGPLPSGLGLMTQLSTLYLYWNGLTGWIPSEVGTMEGIIELDLSTNALSGELPSQLGLMTSATYLHLYRNTLTGSIPSQLGRMTDMVDLKLSENDLTGVIPRQLGFMTALTKLYLYSNSLTGEIPAQMIGRMTKMTSLEFDGNILTGPIPSQLGAMNNLSILSLQRNQLSGSIPSEVGELTNLLRLSARSNVLTGRLPSELGLMTGLSLLHLHDNQLTGSISSEVGRMSNLVELALHENGLEGPLPSQLGSIDGLTKIYLDNNRLSGFIPSNLGNLTGIVDLWLSHNALTGSIPSQVAIMTTLEQLRLENNKLSGTLPTELESLRANGSLTALTLANNSLLGSIPEGLCSMGLFDGDIGAGLSFDCSDQLCGCCWCPCPGSDYSTECETSPFVPSRDDSQWPGSFPTPVKEPNAITINIRTDGYPKDIQFQWSSQDESGAWVTLASGSPPDANSLSSYTHEVKSDSIYRLQILDAHADGSCCASGFGWFTITRSSPSSNDDVDGTLIWEAAGYDLKDYREVILSVDANGNIRLL